MERPVSASTDGRAWIQQLEDTLAEAMGRTGSPVSLVYMLPQGEQVLRLVLLGGLPWDLAAPWARVPLETATPVADAVREERLVWLGGQEEIARHYPQLGMLLPYDFVLASAPVTGGPIRGGIVLAWPVWHRPEPSEEEREAIALCSRRVGQVLGHAVTGRTSLHFDKPRIMAPTRPPDPDPTQARAAYEFAERLPTGCCALDLDGRVTFYNPAALDLVGGGGTLVLGQRPWETLSWLRDPVFEDSFRETVIARRPTTFTAVRPSGTRLDFTLHPGDHGISVSLTPADALTAPPAAPPATAEQGPGSASRPPAAQTPSRRQATVLGEPVGATALYHLTHLAVALTEAVGVRDVARIVCDQLIPGFGAQGLVLLTVEEGRLGVVTHRGYSTEFVERIDNEPVSAFAPHRESLATGKPIFLATYAEFRRSYPDAPRFAMRNAWAFLPLIASGRAMGSLVLSYDRARTFPPSERAVLTSLSGLIAQALDRARLYDAKQTLTRALQTGLLPHSLPHAPGVDVVARYLPAGPDTDIGGDFYDLIHSTSAPATVSAVIGDVEGHNVHAAALMGQIRIAIHALATAGTPPGAVLARTNRLLTDLEPGLFTSCLIAHLDPLRHRARLATAGHPPALLRHPDGHTDILDLAPGLLLGIDPGGEYPTTEVPFPPGSLLVLYTDGLVEVPGTDIEDTTRSLAQQVARADTGNLDELADALVRRAKQAVPRHDDIALLLIRSHPAPGTDTRR
ncbi:SpoIIE family protein phosphatase [Streptomyces sp. NBC_01498]|uniref:PP2C family protein-serine/threonine phosphatase n=1 Tax=Streptomyces sp. NBC_01498 TaxID=2975870 RepID=UPI002E7BCF3E|nr:SpoIIE family protein phosphatase [Streptomyces sp. NBC_01498]WTL28550.1 SpoIIE family protein phosphatase [Streptomyces sp. NBC_01498]